MQGNSSSWYWSRELSLNERLYRINEVNCPPFAIQYVIEGEGLLDPDEIQSKLTELTSYIAALKLNQKGNSWTFSGPSPMLNVHYTAIPFDWDSSFFRAPLSSEQCCEFHLFQTNHSTIVFRVSHAAMDGIGGLMVLQNLFKLLNDQPVEEIVQHPNDLEIRDELEINATKKRQSYNFQCKSLAHIHFQETPIQYQTELIQIPKQSEMFVGKIAKWFMDYAESPAKFLIPVNIRRHNNQIISVANLSLPIYLETHPHETAEEIQGNLLQELMLNNELAADPLEFLAKRAPNWLLRQFISKITKKAIRKNLFPLSGFISDLGLVDLNQYSTTNFQAKNLISLPVFTIIAPFCVTIVRHQNGTRLAFSVPAEFNIKKLKASLSDALSISKETLSKSATRKYKNENEIVEMWAATLRCSAAEINLDASFTDLGGESITLLILITDVGEKFAADKQSDFMMHVLKFGVTITPKMMLELLYKYE